jgi:biotin carboxyl carrier protein
MEDMKGTIILDDTTYKTNLTKKFALRKPYRPSGNKEVRAFIPGSIVDVKAVANTQVREGDLLLILEAMKMKNRIFSPINGKIKQVHIKTGDIVPKDALLVEFE